jgi:hypothetical protein
LLLRYVPTQPFSADSGILAETAAQRTAGEKHVPCPVLTADAGFLPIMLGRPGDSDVLACPAETFFMFPIRSAAPGTKPAFISHE